MPDSFECIEAWVTSLRHKFVRYNPEKVGNARVANGRLGLFSRREGAEMRGGMFELWAKSGNGTRPRVHVALIAGLTLSPTIRSFVVSCLTRRSPAKAGRCAGFPRMLRRPIHRRVSARLC